MRQKICLLQAPVALNLKLKCSGATDKMLNENQIRPKGHRAGKTFCLCS